MVCIEDEIIFFFLFFSEVKEELRPLLRDALPTLEYDMEGDTWIMRLITPHFTKEYKFKSGEELSTHAIDGRDVKVRLTTLLQQYQSGTPLYTRKHLHEEYSNFTLFDQ